MVAVALSPKYRRQGLERLSAILRSEAVSIEPLAIMETVLFVDRRTKSLMQLKDSAIIHVEIGIDEIRVIRGEPRPLYVRDFVPLARNDQADASAQPPVTVSENPIQRAERLFAILHQEGAAYWAAV